MTDHETSATADLPAHLDDSLRSVDELHRLHVRRASPSQRFIRRLTGVLGTPRSAAIAIIFCGTWMAGNVVMRSGAPDPPPFNGLADAAGICALIVTLLVLAAQSYDRELEDHRDRLTLQIALANERKTAKLIELVNELRRDLPVPDKHDAEVVELAQPLDPLQMSEAIKELTEEAAAAESETVL